VGYIGLQISSNIAHGPAQGLMPDEVPADQLGVASGIKTAMDMAGVIISSLLMGFLITSQNADPKRSVLAIMGFLIVFGSLTLFGSHEQVEVLEKRPRIQWRRLWKDTFNFKMNGNRSYWSLIFSRFLYLVGIYGFQSFAQYYIRDKFPQQDPIAYTQIVMGTFVVVLIIFSLLAGALGDKYGRKRIHILSGIIGAVGAVLLIFASTPTQLILFGSVMGVGLGIFMSTNWAMANQMASGADAGKYMGLTNLATAGSAAVARLESPMIDGFNNAAPGHWVGWTVLFAVSAVLMLLSSLALKDVPEMKVEKASE
jgi:MFS family permease